MILYRAGESEKDGARYGGVKTDMAPHVVAFAIQRSDRCRMGSDRGLIPRPKDGGGPRAVSVREVNAILYVVARGCQWQALPKDLPPKGTVHHDLTL